MAPLSKKQLMKAQQARTSKNMTSSIRDDVFKTFAASPAKFTNVAIFNGDNVDVHSVTDAKLSYQGSFGSFNSVSVESTEASKFITPLEKTVISFEESIKKAAAAQTENQENTENVE